MGLAWVSILTEKQNNYLRTAIELVLYILKQLFVSVSVNSGGYLPHWSGSVNIHRYSPPLQQIIVKYCIWWNILVCSMAAYFYQLYSILASFFNEPK